MSCCLSIKPCPSQHLAPIWDRIVLSGTDIWLALGNAASPPAAGGLLANSAAADHLEAA